MLLPFKWGIPSLSLSLSLSFPAVGGLPWPGPALQVLHIENVGCAVPAGAAAGRPRFPGCAFPALRALCVAEPPHAVACGAVLPFRDIRHIIADSLRWRSTRQDRFNAKGDFFHGSCS
jgi:hypothetical protein